MGNIIKAVAVLEIHMLSNADTSITAPTNRRGDAPATESTPQANLRCNCHFSKAKANKNPPKNRKT